MHSKLLEVLGGGDSLPPLAPKEATILRLLIAGGEMYGLEIVGNSDGDVGRGTVYVTLARMEEKGYVVSRQEAQLPGATGLPRRQYRATGEGQRVLAAWEQLAGILRSGGGLTT
jgi:DNA-binding PadR family transcriptional regulator